MKIQALAVDLGGVLFLPDPTLDQDRAACHLQLPPDIVAEEVVAVDNRLENIATAEMLGFLGVK
jgi:hypothetical protein